MTPLQIAKSHCANHQANGSCLGADFDDNLRPRPCHPKPACLLATPGVRCLYFEEAVAPMGTAGWPARQAQDFAEAVRDYRRAACIAHKSRLCPQCKTREIEPGRRFCDSCKAVNRRKAAREFMAKKRGV
jgi:hypothetical protein